MSASNLPRKARYQLEDVADLVIELHSCVHKAAEETSAIRTELGAHRTEVASQFGAVRERVAKLEGRSEAVAQRIGVDPEREKQKPAWFPSPWQLATGLCGAAGGFVVLYQVAVPVLKALNLALLAHH